MEADRQRTKKSKWSFFKKYLGSRPGRSENENELSLVDDGLPTLIQASVTSTHATPDAAPGIVRSTAPSIGRKSCPIIKSDEMPPKRATVASPPNSPSNPSILSNANSRRPPDPVHGTTNVANNPPSVPSAPAQLASQAPFDRAAACLSFPTATVAHETVDLSGPSVPEDTGPKGDLARTLSRYQAALDTMKNALKDDRRSGWGSFDLPELNAVGDQAGVKEIKERVDLVLEAKHKGKEKIASKVNNFVEQIFLTMAPFAKNFLTVAKEAQAVPILNPYGVLCGGLFLLITVYPKFTWPDWVKIAEKEIQRKQEIEDKLDFISQQLGQLRILDSLPRIAVSPDSLLNRAIDVRAACLLFLAIHIHRESQRTGIFSKTRGDGKWTSVITILENAVGAFNDTLVQFGIGIGFKTFDEVQCKPPSIEMVKSIALHPKLDKANESLSKIEEAQTKKLTYDQRKSLRNWLSPPDSSNAAEYYRDNYQTARSTQTDETCSWLVSERVFTEWLNAESSSLLWINGPPGTGKTILAGSIVDRVQRSLNSRNLSSTDVRKPVLYFFCDKKTNEESRFTTISVIRSFLFQLWLSTNKLEQPQFTTFWAKIVLETDLDRPYYLPHYTSSVIELMNMIPEVYIVIDAADECSDRRVLVSELIKIYNLQCTKLKLLITSRPEIDLLRDLRNLPTLEISPTKTSTDMVLVVEAMVESAIKSGKLKLRDPQLKDDIIKALKKGANGMFLWVQLQLSTIIHLSHQTFGVIRKELKRLPQGLTETYESIFSSITQDPSHERTIKIFRWVLGAQRPLNIGELVHATALEEGQRIIDDDDLPPEDIDLLDVCRNLIRIDERTSQVQFIHSSVSEFLMMLKLPESTNPSLETHRHLSAACLTYLMLDCFQTPTGQFVTADTDRVRRNEVRMPNLWGSLRVNEEDNPDRIFHYPNGVSKCEIVSMYDFSSAYPFFQYASLYWPVHVYLACHDDDANSELGPQISRFFGSRALETWILANAALEARIKTIAMNLKDVSTAFHNGYNGTDPSPRKQHFDDLERFVGARNRVDLSTKLWPLGFFSQRLSMALTIDDRLATFGTKLVGATAHKLWLDSSLTPLQTVFLFALAYTCLHSGYLSLETQLERLNRLTPDDIVNTAAKLKSNDRSHARAYYNQAITVTFLAVGQTCDIKSLQLIAEAVKQAPLSPRYGYAFEILYNRCQDIKAADEVTIFTWTRESHAANISLYFRRAVANAYERLGDIKNALAAFYPEMTAAQWDPQLIKILMTMLRGGNGDRESVRNCWLELNEAYPNSQHILLEAMIKFVKKEMDRGDRVWLWKSILYSYTSMYGQFHYCTDASKAPIRVHLNMNSLRIVEQCLAQDFSTEDSTAMVGDKDMIIVLEHCIRENEDNALPERYWALSEKCFSEYLLKLAYLYQPAENSNRLEFWISMTHRNPIADEVQELLRKAYGPRAEPRTGGFWMAIENGQRTNGEGDIAQELRQGGMALKVAGILGLSSLLPEQLFALQPMIDTLRNLWFDSDLPWSPLIYLAYSYMAKDMDASLLILELCTPDVFPVDITSVREALRWARNLNAREWMNRNERKDEEYRRQLEERQGQEVGDEATKPMDYNLLEWTNTGDERQRAFI